MSMKDVPDELVCRVVVAFQDRGLHGPYPYERLAALTGEPEKVCYRAMERAADRGLLEYGVSLRTAWLTPKGIELLKKGIA